MDFSAQALLTQIDEEMPRHWVTTRIIMTGSAEPIVSSRLGLKLIIITDVGPECDYLVIYDKV